MNHAALAPKPTSPATHLRLIMTDDTERRETPTDEAPPPASDTLKQAVPPPPNMPTNVDGKTPATKPPRPMTQAELDAEADAIRASLTPAGIAKVAADKLIEMYQYTRGRDFELLDPEGKLASQQRRLLGTFKTEVVTELGAVVERITENAMSVLGARIEGIARGQVRQGEDIEQLKRDMAVMKTKMGEIEVKIQDIDARSTPTPSAPR